MLPSMMTAQSFVRKRYPKVMDHGAMMRDLEATPTSASFYGSIQPGTGSTTDPTDPINRNGAEVVYTIFGPSGQDVKHDDLVDVAGDTYFVNGAPEQWRTGILDHDVIRLSRWVEGG